jgi:hypothetical protein
MLNRTTIVGLTVALAAFTGTILADDKAPKHVHDSPEMTKCLDECVRCAKECESCYRHCASLLAEGKKEHLRTLDTCSDCGDFCALSAKLIARRGPFLGLACDACAKACDQCGTTCNKFPNDEHMKKCGAACRDCAKACRVMVQQTGTTVTRGE